MEKKHHTKHHHEHHSKKHGYSDSHLKVDKTGHKAHQDMGTEAKKAKLPGQMYVPKRTSNESENFAGEKA